MQKQIEKLIHKCSKSQLRIQIKRRKQLEQIRSTTQIYEKTRIVIIPWGVELNNDEVLLANNVGKVGMVQGENKLLRFRFFSADSSKR